MARYIYTIVLAVLLWQLAGSAQNVTVLEESNVAIDTTESMIIPDSLLAAPVLSEQMIFGRMMVPFDGPRSTQMTEAEKKAYIKDVLSPSITSNLKAQMFSLPVRLIPFYYVAGFFLTPQLVTPYGYWAYNNSFPYILAKVPGGEPYYNKYSPDLIPQAIRLEFDEKTGTYKQVMNDWSEVMEKSRNWHLGGYSTEPINIGPINPVERSMYQINNAH